MDALLRNTARGLYCSKGDFYIDPWRPVDVAIITHAHSDHARAGSKSYLCSQTGASLLRARLGEAAPIQGIDFGEKISRNGVTLSLHPAGHILGSAQVRVESGGEIWVVSGDYKTEKDATAEPFELVTCHTFITESTFGLPIYCWPDSEETIAEINAWWRQNQSLDRTSVLFSYALGKAQRLLSGLDPSIGPIFLHGAVERMVEAYAESGIMLPKTAHADFRAIRQASRRGLVLAPPSADNSIWLRKFGEVSTAFASGWMQIRGTRRRRALDRGFVVSDHVDWPALIQIIRATGAKRVWVTHGYTGPVVRWLRENGWDAAALKTEFEGESMDGEAGEDDRSETAVTPVP